MPSPRPAYAVCRPNLIPGTFEFYSVPLRHCNIHIPGVQPELMLGLGEKRGGLGTAGKTLSSAKT